MTIIIEIAPLPPVPPTLWEQDRARWEDAEVPYGPRSPRVSVWSRLFPIPFVTEETTHAVILAALSRYLDDVVSGVKRDDDGTRAIVTAAAYDLVFSDMETGSSLADWDSQRRVVDRALGWAMGAGSMTFVTTEWETF